MPVLDPTARRQPRARLVGLRCVLGALFLAGAADAQSAAERASARQLMDRGDEQAAAGDLNAALSSYQGAHAIMHVPTTGVEVARALEQTGLLVEAREAALEVLRMPIAKNEPKPFQLARADAGDLAQRLIDQIPLLTIELVQTDLQSKVSFSVDGNEVASAALGLPYSLNPGPHRLALSAPRYETVALDIDLARGERKSIAVRFQASSSLTAVSANPPLTPVLPAAPAKTSAATPHEVTRAQAQPVDKSAPWPVWVGLGAAGAGVIVGSASGIYSLERAKQARTHCNGNQCTEAAAPDRDASLTAARISNVSWVFAGAGAALGVTTWFLSRPHDSSASKARVALSPTKGGGMIDFCGELF